MRSKFDKPFMNLWGRHQPDCSFHCPIIAQHPQEIRWPVTISVHANANGFLKLFFECSF